ncbi:hypothetical protein CDV36_016375 [Fusarium kuroshium]|uniref:Uncharacterized protein n=2 Tax=Fusarium solani species complex TaxID=232080 RepID=A0A3M2QS47_9HYPO|nr:hypothetical protein CDV36_016375 [Fusarium kuroshium]RSL80825.1 hypothetical protein CDV31_017092 [Fusarium ambrosium]
MLHRSLFIHISPQPQSTALTPSTSDPLYLSPLYTTWQTMAADCAAMTRRLQHQLATTPKLSVTIHHLLAGCSLQLASSHTPPRRLPSAHQPTLHYRVCKVASAMTAAPRISISPSPTAHNRRLDSGLCQMTTKTAEALLAVFMECPKSDLATLLR